MRCLKSKKVRILVLCLGLVLLAATVAACGGSATTTTTAAPGATTTSAAGGVTTTAPAETTTTVAAAPTSITVIMPSPAVYPFFEPYVAKAQGFFDKYNLKVDIVDVDGSEAAITAFASNQGQVINGDPGTYLNKSATAQFHPVMFYLATNAGVFDIVVPADSNIQSAKDLDGMVVGVNSEQDPGSTLIKTVNDELGINMKPLIVNEAGQALAAFQRGDIVAYACSVVGVATLESQGFPLRSVITPEQKSSSGALGYWATKDFMDANGDALTGFVKALQEARAYIGSDPQKLVDWQNSQSPIAQADMAYNLAMAKACLNLRPTDVSPVGFVPPDSFQRWWDNLVENGVVDPSIGQPTDYYTNQFNQ